MRSVVAGAAAVCGQAEGDIRGRGRTEPRAHAARDRALDARWQRALRGGHPPAVHGAPAAPLISHEVPRAVWAHLSQPPRPWSRAQSQVRDVLGAMTVGSFACLSIATVVSALYESGASNNMTGGMICWLVLYRILQIYSIEAPLRAEAQCCCARVRPRALHWWGRALLRSL